MHIGVIQQTRLDALVADIAGLGITPVATMQVGDVTNTAVESEDTAALAWLNELPNDWYIVSGNHDITVSRSPDQFATTYGMSARNFVIELANCVLICVSMDSYGNHLAWSQDQLDWLDAQLTTYAAKPCLIFYHVPLANTVGGDTAVCDTSFEDGFKITNSAAIETILGNHDNARAFIAGHTHSPWDAPDFVMTKRLGNHNVAIINAGSPWYTYFSGEYPRHVLYIEVQATYLDVWVRQFTTSEWLEVYRITP